MIRVCGQRWLSKHQCTLCRLHVKPTAPSQQAEGLYVTLLSHPAAATQSEAVTAVLADLEFWADSAIAGVGADPAASATAAGVPAAAAASQAPTSAAEAGSGSAEPEPPPPLTVAQEAARAAARALAGVGRSSDSTSTPNERAGLPAPSAGNRKPEAGARGSDWALRPARLGAAAAAAAAAADSVSQPVVKPVVPERLRESSIAAAEARTDLAALAAAAVASDLRLLQQALPGCSAVSCAAMSAALAALLRPPTGGPPHLRFLAPDLIGVLGGIGRVSEAIMPVPERTRSTDSDSDRVLSRNQSSARARECTSLGACATAGRQLSVDALCS